MYNEKKEAIMIIGKSRAKISELILGISGLLLVASFFAYQAWSEGKVYQIATPIINFIVFTGIFVVSWRVRRNNDRLEISNETLRVRNSLKIDTFQIDELHELRIKKFLSNWLCFKFNGFSYYYPLGRLTSHEKDLLNEFVQSNQR